MKSVLPLLRRKAKRSEGVLHEVFKELIQEARKEKRERRRLTKVYDKYASCSWEDFGALGRVILLLYCSNLLRRAAEREKCVISSGSTISEGDLMRIVELGPCLSSLEEMDEIGEVLTLVTATEYFRKELLGRASPVVKALRGFAPLSSTQIDEVEEFEKARTALLGVYKSEFKLYVHGKRTSSKESPVFPAFKEAELMRLASSIVKSPTLSCLMARRPNESMLPHAVAVVMCAEHAMLWLHESASLLRIFLPLPITYAHLREGALSGAVEASIRALWNNREPSRLDLVSRQRAVALLDKSREHEGDLHFGRPEDFPTCSDDVPLLVTEVAKMVLLPFRCKEEQLDHSRAANASSTIDLVHKLWSAHREAPQYSHLFRLKLKEKP